MVGEGETPPPQRASHVQRPGEQSKRHGRQRSGVPHSPGQWLRRVRLALQHALPCLRMKLLSPPMATMLHGEDATSANADARILQ